MISANDNKELGQIEKDLKSMRKTFIRRHSKIDQVVNAITNEYTKENNSIEVSSEVIAKLKATIATIDSNQTNIDTRMYYINRYAAILSDNIKFLNKVRSEENFQFYKEEIGRRKDDYAICLEELKEDIGKNQQQSEKVDKTLILCGLKKSNPELHFRHLVYKERDRQ